MINNFKKIYDDSELKTQIDSNNNLKLSKNTYNLDIKKNIRLDEQFILKGSIDLLI